MRQILLFSLPSVAASLLEPLAGIVDTALVGQIDTTMLASLAVGTTILASFTWIFNFLIHASTQGIAAAAFEDIGGRVRMSLSVALVVAVMSAVGLYFARFYLYEFLRAPNIGEGLIDEYFLPRLLGHPSRLSL